MQELDCAPTPTLSPTLCLLTFVPTLTTFPTISCPGVNGYWTNPQMFLIMWQSVPQTPQCVTAMSTMSSVHGRIRISRQTSPASIASGPSASQPLNVVGVDIVIGSRYTKIVPRVALRVFAKGCRGHQKRLYTSDSVRIAGEPQVGQTLLTFGPSLPLFLCQKYVSIVHSNGNRLC